MITIDIVDAAVTADQIQPMITNPPYFKFGWPSNSTLGSDQGHWNHTFTKYTSNDKEIETALMAVDRSTELDSIYQPFWKAAIDNFGPRRLCRGYFNGYTYGTDAFLHRDVDYKKFPADHDCIMETVLFYLNDKWDPNWGGETVFLYDQEIIKSILPKQGRAIRFDSTVYHGARPLSRKCYTLRQVLVFKTVVDAYPEDEALDFLFKHTNLIPHSKTSLFEHLYGTYEIMKVLEFPRYMCLAGLYQAAYNAERFLFSREQVLSKIGKRAEELVYRYTNKQPLSVDTYDMAAIEYASLLEQSERVDVNVARVRTLKDIIKK